MCRHCLDHGLIGIGANMGVEAADRPLSLVLYPARIIIVLTDDGINQRTGLDRHRL